MRVLVISNEPRWTEALRGIFRQSDDLVSYPDTAVTEVGRIMPAMDLCVVGTGTVDQGTVEIVANLRTNAATPIFVVCERADAEWRESLLVAGAYDVFTTPLRSRMIGIALSRVRPAAASSSSRTPFPHPAPPTPPPAHLHNGEVLALLRDLSRLLLHAGDGPLFLEAYLRKLREALRCERMILYLVDSSTPDRKYKSSFASGVAPEAFGGIRLSRDDGIGHLLAQRIALLQRCRLRDDIAGHHAAAREMDVFGVELAFPLTASGTLVGVLLVGPRIAGNEYTDTELTLVFHLMEELGAVVRNTELQAELNAERRLLAAVLHELPSACLVVDSDLRIAHVNGAARALLGTKPDAPVKFEDLPQSWASAAYGVVSGKTPPGESVVVEGNRHTRLVVRPLARDVSTSRALIIITIDDVTKQIAAERDAAIAGTHALLQRVGQQLANEFRNALTPFHTMVQLGRGSPADRTDVMEKLSGVMAEGMNRLQRRVDDLAYLSTQAINPEITTLSRVMTAARARFENFAEGNKRALVRWPEKYPDVTLSVDVRAIGLAIAEIVTNGVEACADKPVEVSAESDANGIKIRVRNHGKWQAPSESGGLGHRPFVTDKAMGVGLGLEVVSRIATNHGGRFSINPVAAEAIEADFRIPHNNPA